MHNHHNPIPTSTVIPPWPDRRRLRGWQRRAHDAVRTHPRQDMLIEACPGAGKTTLAMRVAHDMLSCGDVSQVIVLAPTRHIGNQWAIDAAKVGIAIEPNFAHLPLPPDVRGAAITYSRLASMPELYRHLVAQGPTLLIADEVHHVATERSWGDAYALAFEHATFRLALTGTPFRSDDAPIPGVTYDHGGTAKPDFSYGYREAIEGGICRKVVFTHFDGELSWAVGGDVVEASFGRDLNRRQSRLRHRTAVSTRVNEGLRRMIADADTCLTQVRRDGHPDAGALALACDIQHAEELAELIHQIAGEKPVVVHSDAGGATDKIDRFRRSDQRWIVAVGMISEGVDIPRLRVLLYATTIRAPLFFRQAIGRVVRTTPGMTNEPSHVLLPAEPALVNLSLDVEREIRHVLQPTAEKEVPCDLGGDGGAEDQERKEDLIAFVPLGSQVAPTTAVMSGLHFADATEATAVETLSKRLAVSPLTVIERLEMNGDPVPRPLADETPFQRRKRLRDRRKRLVRYLVRVKREQGVDVEHRDVNQWVNEAVAGGRPVSEHAVAELERSLRLLSREVVASDRLAA